MVKLDLSLRVVVRSGSGCVIPIEGSKVDFDACFLVYDLFINVNLERNFNFD